MGPNAYRAVRCLFGAALLSLLAGCSTMQDFAGLDHAGYQADGSYVMTAEEKSMGCRLLTERANKITAGLAGLPDAGVAEQSTTPPTVSAVFQRTFGSPGDGLNSAAQLKRGYGEVIAINATLVEKGCPPVDIAAPFGGLRDEPTTATH